MHIRKADEAEPIDFFKLPPTRMSIGLVLSFSCDDYADNFIEVYTFHRSVLQKLLARHLDTSIPIHFSKRLASYTEPSEPSDSLVLQFRDGTSATCDVLIGSDGIKSAVRRSMFNAFADDARLRGNEEESLRLRSMTDPVWSGQTAYRGLIPTAALKTLGCEDVSHPLFVSEVFGMLSAMLTDALFHHASFSGRIR